MAFDIYGENLRSGHCEVHPHVHESYPCSVCYDESRRDAQQSNYHKDAEIECRKEYEQQQNHEYNMALSFKYRQYYRVKLLLQMLISCVDKKLKRHSYY